MGHLGQGTSITTVGDKEIVLTASDGQTFKMKITDLAEAVRQVMPVATIDKNGLMNKASLSLLLQTSGIPIPYGTILGSQLDLVPNNRFCSIAGGRIDELMKSGLDQNCWGFYMKIAGLSNYVLELFYSLNINAYSGYRLEKTKGWVKFNVI